MAIQVGKRGSQLLKSMFEVNDCVSSNITIWYDVKNFKKQFQIEKVFGILEKKTNIVVKFRFILSASLYPGSDGVIKFQLKMIYLNEDPIDCHTSVTIANSDTEPTSKWGEDLNIGDEVFSSRYNR